MELTRRQILRWFTLAAMGGISVNLSGCGKGLTGSLLHAAAQGGAKPPLLPKGFVQRNDLAASPRPELSKRSQSRLIGLAQLSDIHITLDDFTLTGYPGLERLMDGFGEAIGFGGLDRPEDMEHFDVDVLRATVKTLNASKDNIDLVINTGDSLDIGTMPELIAFLSEMNNLDIPWFQTIGNHDRLGLGNIPPGLLGAFSDLDFVDKDKFIRKHFPREETSAKTAYGSRAKGFDFSPGFQGFPESSKGFYAFTARPPIHGGPGELIQPGIRFYVLNSSRRAGSAWGRLENEQLRWLSAELEAHPDHLALVVSHHPVQMIREGRDELVEILHHYPQVIALLCGHDHTHRIEAFAPRGEPARGFWQIQTSSLMDYPQQGRMVEVLNNGDGTGTIRTYVFNQQAGGDLGKNARTSFLAARGDGFDGSGEKQDRAAELLFQMPKWGSK